MQIEDRINQPLVCGRIGLDYRFDNGRIQPICRKSNQIQYSWGYVAAQAIGKGDRNFKIGTLYVEFENVTLPGDAVTVPSYGREEGREYYQDLSLSGVRDFLRVPMLLDPSIGIEAGFEDFFTAGIDGNKLTFFTQTQGTQGFHGKSFNDGVNSKVFGAALVVTPEFGDPTKDVIFARTYFDVADQTLKLASSQVGITWEVSFE